VAGEKKKKEKEKQKEEEEEKKGEKELTSNMQEDIWETLIIGMRACVTTG
jgi:hypothetical protein